MKFSKGKCRVLHLGFNEGLGAWLAGKQLCRKGPGSPNAQVEDESAVGLCSKGGQKHSGLY